MKTTCVNAYSAIQHPATRVWAVIRNFADISWMPSVEKSELVVGSRQIKRSTYLQNNDTPVIEVLTYYDNDALELSYSAESGLLIDIGNYTVTIKVMPKDESQCEILWTSSFDSAEADAPYYQEFIENIYIDILNALAVIVNQSSAVDT